MIDMQDLDRRNVLAGLAALLGVATLPAQALAGPTKAARHLPQKRFALLAGVCDTILPTTDTPGALAAGVPARIDAMVRDWAAPSTRDELLGALDRIDSAARTARGRAFLALSPEQRAEVLREHDKTALKAAPRTDGSKPLLFDLNAVPADPAYKRLKDLVIALYYYSPTGSEHELRYEHVPGPFEPSIKLTPASRPYLGLSPL